MPSLNATLPSYLKGVVLTVPMDSDPDTKDKGDKGDNGNNAVGSAPVAGPVPPAEQAATAPDSAAANGTDASANNGEVKAQVNAVLQLY